MDIARLIHAQTAAAAPREEMPTVGVLQSRLTSPCEVEVRSRIGRHLIGAGGFF